MTTFRVNPAKARRLAWGTYYEGKPIKTAAQEAGMAPTFIKHHVYAYVASQQFLPYRDEAISALREDLAQYSREGIAARIADLTRPVDGKWEPSRALKLKCLLAIHKVLGQETSTTVVETPVPLVVLARPAEDVPAAGKPEDPKEPTKPN